MMEGVKDDFYVEDEHVEDVRRAWDLRKPVLVIPSRMRRYEAPRAERWPCWMPCAAPQHG
jgi:hypothetical protein